LFCIQYYILKKDSVENGIIRGDGCGVEGKICKTQVLIVEHRSSSHRLLFTCLFHKNR
jgi:hypothetical protein